MMPGMAPQTPYSPDLGDRDPLAAMRESADGFRSVAAGWSPQDFERSYAPGKWTARQVLIHLAQTELALGTRARMALATPHYASQSFDQDRWMTRETTLSGAEAVAALVAVNAMNRALFSSLGPADRATTFSHPEYGALTVQWLMEQIAGHLIHHLVQLDQIAKG